MNELSLSKLRKREYIGYAAMIIIGIVFSLGEEGDLSYIIFSTLSEIFLWCVLILGIVYSFSKTHDKWIHTIKLSMLTNLWAICFFMANVLRTGRVVSLLNGVALLAVIANIITLIRGRKQLDVDVNPMKFGYIWVGLVLLIPFFVIGVLIGL